MSLIRLRTFVEVYRQRSITAAAKVLNLTQPAVSQHIAGLESAVGKALFERQTHGVLPTSAADELAADIGNKLDAAEAALATARARSSGIAGTLQIIGHADFMAEKLPEGLVPLLEADIRVRMHTGDGPMVIQMLLEGQCELGISAHPMTDERLKSEVIYTDNVLAVASPAVAERLMCSASLSAALSREPLLSYNLELSLINDWMEKNRVALPDSLPAAVGQDLRALRSLLTKGFGWTVLPEYLCTGQLQRGELVNIPAPISDTTITYNLVWLPASLRQPRVAWAKNRLSTLLRK
ncbi:LysR family transcriptional regulator [Lelliottia amnigena]|uniref:LysR family transcriptional regulator n=1 Tax=Lelliottia amnigena TaxID=61646 RepID=UPI001F3F8AB9|nr:LysR family transcriptional regulator [Lelliottia amnigena]UJD95366.1 LysR family transcriptional regulator [Lelliottia amnigena]